MATAPVARHSIEATELGEQGALADARLSGADQKLAIRSAMMQCSRVSNFPPKKIKHEDSRLGRENPCLAMQPYHTPLAQEPAGHSCDGGASTSERSIQVGSLFSLGQLGCMHAHHIVARCSLPKLISCTCIFGGPANSSAGDSFWALPMNRRWACHMPRPTKSSTGEGKWLKSLGPKKASAARSTPSCNVTFFLSQYARVCTARTAWMTSYFTP